VQSPGYCQEIKFEGEDVCLVDGVECDPKAAAKVEPPISSEKENMNT